MGSFFSVWVFSYQTFVELRVGPWGFTHKLTGPRLDDRKIQGEWLRDFMGTLWKP